MLDGPAVPRHPLHRRGADERPRSSASRRCWPRSPPRCEPSTAPESCRSPSTRSGSSRTTRRGRPSAAPTLPEDYEWGRSVAGGVEAALSGPEHEPVPCHDDLLAANFLRSPDGIRIVDWEYAGMGDRYFDLGNFAVNNELDEGQETALLDAYFGQPPTPARLASLRLMRFMSDFREAMWGVLQGTLSDLDFDFAEYADEHFGRMRKTAADPGFETWLEEAAGAAG